MTSYDHLAEKSNTFDRCIGVKDLASDPPPVVDRGGLCPLLYHSDHNSASSAEKKEKILGKNKKYKPNNRQAKMFKVLDMNAKHWMKIYGKEHIGILTLTFKENLTCMKEAQRRWNSFSRQFNKHGKFELLVKVAEPQKRGAVHYHCLVRTYGKIRTGINWDIYEKMGEANTKAEKYKLGRQVTTNKYLKELWSWINKTTESTGFGRTELMPLKKPDHIKNYVGKYLEKDMQNNALKKDGKNRNMRMITYGKNAPKVANQQFSWVNGKSSIFRRKLKSFCEARGISSTEELVEIYGKSWSFHLYKEIMFDRVIGYYEEKKFKELNEPDKYTNKAVYPWKGQIVSGAFTHETIEKMVEDYLTPERNRTDRGSSLSQEFKRLDAYRKKENYRKHNKWIHD